MASSNTFGEILKWGVIIGGAYLAYTYFFAPSVAVATPATPVTPPATPAAPAATTTTTASTPSTASPGVGVCPLSTCPPTTDSIVAQTAKVTAAAGALASSPQTASVWNWYFNTAYGLPTTTTWLLGDNGQPMSLAAYLALRQGFGFSGYSGLGARRNYIPAGAPMVRPMNYRRAA